MNILIVSGALILLIFGAVYPLVAMVLLVRRMNQPNLPPIKPMGVALRLMLVATVPLAGILGGFAGLRADVWQSDFLRYLIWCTGGLSIVGFLLLAIMGRAEKSSE